MSKGWLPRHYHKLQKGQMSLHCRIIHYSIRYQQLYDKCANIQLAIVTSYLRKCLDFINVMLSLDYAALRQCLLTGLVSGKTRELKPRGPTNNKLTKRTESEAILSLCSYKLVLGDNSMNILLNLKTVDCIITHILDRLKKDTFISVFCLCVCLCVCVLRGYILKHSSPVKRVGKLVQ